MNVPIAVLAGLVVTQISIVATTVYLHRTLAHRAHACADQRCSSAACCCGSPPACARGNGSRCIVATRDVGHARRPPQPRVLGFWRVQLANVPLYRRVRDELTVRRYAGRAPGSARPLVLQPRHPRPRDRDRDPVRDVRLGDRAAGGRRARGELRDAQRAINAVGHTRGRRPYDNPAGNSQWLALFTAGEGLHNSHHAAPTSARFALAPERSTPAGG